MKKIPTVFERTYENHKVVGISDTFTSELAIEALGVAESAATTDCISRQQAIDAIEKEIERIRENPCVFSEGDFYYQNALKLAQEIIELQPPVNQKQITGKLESAENATSEGEESTMSQPKSKLDCISRKDAIEEIALHDCTNGEVLYFTGKGVQDILNNLPPVTPTERIGEWEDTIGGIYVCSNCKSSFTDIPKDGYWKPMWNFCPNCGAKMKGADDE